MHMVARLFSLFSICTVSAFSVGTGTTSNPAPYLAKNGQPEAAIVVGRNSGPFYQWVASEVQRYVHDLSGATLPIVADDELPNRIPLIVLGGPASNPLAADAEEKRLVRFAGLKPDGFVVGTADLEDRPVIVAGGNDEAGTMYAAYELLERLGVVFQLTGDIIPVQKPDLPLPDLDVRMEPVFKDRGMHCWHGIRWYMGLNDLRKEIDQLAKLKMNVFQFYWGMGGPWAEFSYDGKVAEISAPKESGYVAWPGASGTANSVVVGRECFPEDGYMGPPEFSGVQSQEEAYRTARDFLRELIRYAHARKIRVWLTMGEIPYVPENLVPPDSKRGHNFYCGVALSPSDPAVLDIWEAAVRSMIENYPEADRYWVVSGSELLGGTRPVHGVAATDPQVQAFVRDYGHLLPLIPPKSQAAVDAGLAYLDLADIAVADKLVRRIREDNAAARLGLELIFRGGQLRALDAALPKDVALMNMVNFKGETAMNFFDGIHGRDLVVWPRITDDGCELNIQLNAKMYDHDEVIAGGVKYGLTGILGQLNKSRGAEQSAQYIAEGSWNPEIRCQSFYERYLSRLYGPDALDALLKAFLSLEENEKELGWHGRHGVLSTWSASSRLGIKLRAVNYKENPLTLNWTDVDKAILTAEEERRFWDDRAAQCGQALELLRQVRPEVLPGSREELDYVIYKTQNLVTVFHLLGQAREASAAFDRALAAAHAAQPDESKQQFEQCQTALDRASELIREAAQQMIPYAHIPTERHILWIINKAIPTYDTARDYLHEVMALQMVKS
ncbi:MAG: hypothetical protein IT365_07460 [Candidatus Hydrogenedentes bacterium]|nr:hypothetical protein [Candidatus Hydrogenedentota bacterium]